MALFATKENKVEAEAQEKRYKQLQRSEEESIKPDGEYWVRPRKPAELIRTADGRIALKIIRGKEDGQTVQNNQNKGQQVGSKNS